MPTYQYLCTECGHAFEQFQSFSEDSLTTCPECTGRLRKVFNSVGVVFKGSGFYKTDSRTSSTAGTSTASSSGDGSSTGAATAGSSSSTGSSGSSSETSSSSSASSAAAAPAS
ncbi:FmdB family zinc ribbon protein [Nocardioides sp. SYSU DS0651]|uniref:FmdB family zinc ribbon protein n=1 Tax=Nocardioides sp. SYSU DS0651 TaxID=3415955 RepID=UPI003F4B7DEA